MISLSKYIFVSLILLITIILYRKFAVKTGILDIPSHRSSHSKPVIRGGGIIFFLAVLLAVFTHPEQFLVKPRIFFVAGFILLSVLGFIDDLRNLRQIYKFPVQFLSVILILAGAGIFEYQLPVYVILLAVIVGTGFVNAVNFMDGINGITATYAMVLTVTYAVLNYIRPLLPQDLFIYLMIALIIFSYYNFRKKALLFSGDVGSMALAGVFLFIIAKFMLYYQAPALLLTVAVYGVDSAMTIIYRWLKKQPVWEAHRCHVYQKLVDHKNLSHLQTALLYGSVQAIINAIVILLKLYLLPFWQQFFLTVSVLFIMVLIHKMLYGIENDKCLKKV